MLCICVQPFYHVFDVVENGGIPEYEKNLTPHSGSQDLSDIFVTLVVFHAYEEVCNVYAVQYTLTINFCHDAKRGELGDQRHNDANF